jgi:polar amino acid transport system substrate-binding protein
MKKELKFATTILVVGLCLMPSFAQKKLVIATPGFDHPISQVAAKVLPEAYKKLGYDVEFQTLPPQRAINMLEDGSVDAYIFSDISLIKDSPKGVQVNTPIGFDDIVVFTKRADITVTGWDSLKPYSLGYMVGMSVIESHIKGMKTDPAQNPAQAFQKMDAGRTDVVVMPRGVGLMMIKNLKLKGLNVLDPPLEKVALYHFLSAKQAALAPKLAAVLADMTKSGQLKTITDQVEADFLK